MTALRSALLLLALLVSPVWAAPEYREGTHYERLDAPLPSADAAGVQVQEFFWYGCSHCYALEPHLAAWRENLPEGVTFERVAPPLNSRWVTHAKAFYAAKALGVLDRVHEDLFAAIHEERQALDTPEALADFFAKHGVDRQRFLDTYGSFGVAVQAREAGELATSAGLMGVPAIVVDGRYRTDVAMAKGYRDVLDVVDFLIRKARTEAASNGTP